MVNVKLAVINEGVIQASFTKALQWVYCTCQKVQMSGTSMLVGMAKGFKAFRWFRDFSRWWETLFWGNYGEGRANSREVRNSISLEYFVCIWVVPQPIVEIFIEAYELRFWDSLDVVTAPLWPGKLLTTCFLGSRDQDFLQTWL